MLFNPNKFLFVLLPMTWLGYFVLSRIGVNRGLAIWLLAASIWFYAYWEPRNLEADSPT